MYDTEHQAAISDGMEAVLTLLPGWETLTWREQARLADSLHYLSEALRDSSRARNLDEMRGMAREGRG